MRAREEACIQCGETRGMAAFGVCDKCYRSLERARNRVFSDRRNPAMRKEHKKCVRAYTKLMVALADLGATREDTLDVLRIVQPYIAMIGESLRQVILPESEPVNSVLDSCLPFTDTPDDSGRTATKVKIHTLPRPTGEPN